MLKFGGGEQLALPVQILEHQRIGVLDKGSGIGRFRGHIALSVHKLDEGQIVPPAHPSVILAKGGSHMHHAGAVGQGDIIVAADKKGFFLLFFAGIPGALV